MDGQENISNFGAVVVGAESEPHVNPATMLLERLAVNFAVCPDLYAAVSELAGNSARRGIVIGRLEHLSREKGLFFEKALKFGWVCCCVTKKISGASRAQAIKAMKSGAIVVNDHRQLEDVVMRIIGGGSATLPGDA